MAKMVELLRERLSTRKGVVQLVVLVLMVLVMADFITLDWLDGAAKKAVAVLSIAGPALALAMKDPAKADPADIAAVLEDLTKMDPRAVTISVGVNAVADALERVETGDALGFKQALESVVNSSAAAVLTASPEAVAQAMDRLGVKR